MMYLSAIRAQTRAFLGKFIKNEQGVTAIEYAVVAAGIAIVCVAVFKKEGPVDEMLSNTFSTLKSKMETIISDA